MPSEHKWWSFFPQREDGGFFSKLRQAIGANSTDAGAGDGSHAGTGDDGCAGSNPPPARITLLYESRDGRLCAFEDAEGHLTAVRAEKLA